MILNKIDKKDLIFTNNIEDDRTNTYLKLYDYDWMDYNLTTRFKTKSMGVLDVKFYYFGMVLSHMEVKQTLNDTVETVIYEYPTDIFQKHFIKYLKKHISFWDSKYAFNGEEEVIDFFNDVLENGTIKEHRGKILISGNSLNMRYATPEEQKNIQEAIEKIAQPTSVNFWNYHEEPSPCDGCSNNPKNGGSGICHCTLGQKVFY